MSTTEAVRRLISPGRFLYQTTRIDGYTVLVQVPGEDPREVVVL